MKSSSQPQKSFEQTLFITIYKLSKLRCSQLFLQPVSTVLYPDYPSIIACPMDITTILTKLKSGKYSYIYEIYEDLLLIAKNCFQYNRGKRSQQDMNKIVGRWVKSMNAGWNALKRQLRQLKINQDRKIGRDKQTLQKIQAIQQKLKFAYIKKIQLIKDNRYTQQPSQKADHSLHNSKISNRSKHSQVNNNNIIDGSQCESNNNNNNNHRAATRNRNRRSKNTLSRHGTVQNYLTLQILQKQLQTQNNINSRVIYPKATTTAVKAQSRIQTRSKRIQNINNKHAQNDDKISCISYHTNTNTNTKKSNNNNNNNNNDQNRSRSRTMTRSTSKKTNNPNTPTNSIANINQNSQISSTNNYKRLRKQLKNTVANSNQPKYNPYKQQQQLNSKQYNPIRSQPQPQPPSQKHYQQKIQQTILLPKQQNNTYRMLLYSQDKNIQQQQQKQQQQQQLQDKQCSNQDNQSQPISILSYLQYKQSQYIHYHHQKHQHEYQYQQQQAYNNTLTLPQIQQTISQPTNSQTQSIYHPTQHTQSIHIHISHNKCNQHSYSGKQQKNKQSCDSQQKNSKISVKLQYSGQNQHENYCEKQLYSYSLQQQSTNKNFSTKQWPHPHSDATQKNQQYTEQQKQEQQQQQQKGYKQEQQQEQEQNLQYYQYGYGYGQKNKYTEQQQQPSQSHQTNKKIQQQYNKIIRHKLKKYKIILKNCIKWIYVHIIDIYPTSTCTQTHHTLYLDNLQPQHSPHQPQLPTEQHQHQHQHQLQQQIDQCNQCRQYIKLRHIYHQLSTMKSYQYLQAFIYRQLDSLSKGQINLKNILKLLKEINLWVRLVIPSCAYLQRKRGRRDRDQYQSRNNRKYRKLYDWRIKDQYQHISNNIIKSLQKIIQYKKLGPQFTKLLQQAITQNKQQKQKQLQRQRQAYHDDYYSNTNTRLKNYNDNSNSERRITRSSNLLTKQLQLQSSPRSNPKKNKYHQFYDELFNTCKKNKQKQVRQLDLSNKYNFKSTSQKFMSARTSAHSHNRKPQPQDNRNSQEILQHEEFIKLLEKDGIYRGFRVVIIGDQGSKYRTFKICQKNQLKKKYNFKKNYQKQEDDQSECQNQYSQQQQQQQYRQKSSKNRIEQRSSSQKHKLQRKQKLKVKNYNQQSEDWQNQQQQHQYQQQQTQQQQQYTQSESQSESEQESQYQQQFLPKSSRRTKQPRLKSLTKPQQQYLQHKHDKLNKQQQLQLDKQFIAQYGLRSNVCVLEKYGSRLVIDWQKMKQQKFQQLPSVICLQ